MRDLVIAVSLILLFLFPIACTHAEGPASRPNLLFILTDDQCWDAMGCMGNTIIQTPNIDKLAARGVLFRNHFVTSSICCVSRA